MAKKKKKKIKTRDIFMFAILTTPGGVSRKFADRKKKAKEIRGKKHKKEIEN